MSPLSPNQWHVLSPYLDQALTLSEEECSRWLESLRAENPEIARMVRELLNEHKAAEKDGFLEKGPVLHDATGLAGETVGAYRLVSMIGYGGMGTVWLAERCDGRFESRVAVKFLNIALIGRGVEQRFKREGAILARLSHPNIAKLLDAGVTRAGQPYLVLEYIEGVPIDRYCEDRGLDIDGQLSLFLDVLSAIAHAHANLIVHRDIKPSNVLVSAEGQVKLLDFGIAKLLEGDGQEGAATLLTKEAGPALTPEYAAPEQLTGGPVTTATDVYELGVLLYVLLTRQHPAGAGVHTPAELLRAIAEVEPRRPSDVATSQPAEAKGHNQSSLPIDQRIRRQLRGDLDTIVAKALKKNPQERYWSAAALAEDLDRYLRNQPISARSDSFLYSAAKFVRRHRPMVAMSALAAIAVIAAVIGILFQSQKVRSQRDFALRQVERSEVLNEFHQFLLSEAAPSGKPLQVNELLKRAEEIVARQHTSNDANRVQLMIAIGRQYLEQDEQANARRVLEDAYKQSRAISDVAVRAAGSCTLASVLARDLELQRAERLYQEGLRELPHETQFALERVNCLQSGTEIVQETGQIREGIARAEEAQRVLRQSPFSSDVLEVHRWMDLAKVYGSAGMDAKAVSAYEKAGTLLESLGRDETGTAISLFNNWALELEQVGRPLDAERLYRRAIEISKAGHTEESVSPIVLSNYARSLRELHRFEEAADYSDRAVARARRSGDELNRPLLERARIYMAEGDTAHADVLLSDVEARFRKSLPSGHFAFGVLALEQAQNALQKGNTATATRLADHGILTVETAIKSGGEGSNYLPRLLIHRAAVHLAAKQPVEAVADARRAVGLLEPKMEHGFSSHLGYAYLALGDGLQAQGKPDEARNAFRSAAQHLEKTIGSDHPDTQRARQLGA